MYLMCINFRGVLIFAVDFTVKISTPRKLIHRENTHNLSQYFGKYQDHDQIKRLGGIDMVEKVLDFL